MTRTRTLGTLAAVVGFLAFVEFTSGVLQGYYTPMLTDIARHLGIHDADVNWLEGTQLMLSALVVPAFAKLGDMVGHKRMLLISTAVTAAAALVLPFTDSFPVFLAAWALMGFYVVWLPLEIALIWSRSRRMEGRSSITAKAAGLLVAASKAARSSVHSSAARSSTFFRSRWCCWCPPS
jgi:MFS family permease